MSSERLTATSRSIAAVLAVVWLCLGAAGTYLGVVGSSWLSFGCGLFAIFYSWAWWRVASRARRLSWREFIAPWR